MFKLSDTVNGFHRKFYIAVYNLVMRHTSNGNSPSI